MIFFRNLMCIALICLAVAGADAQKTKKKKNEPAPPPPPPPAFALKNKTDSVCYAVAVSIGDMLKSRGMDTVNTEAFAKGMEDFFSKKQTFINPEQSNAFLQSYFQAQFAKKAEADKAASKKYLDENKAKPGVITTASGLQYQVVSTGTGPKPKATDKVKVHYTGTLTDGKKFDSSIDRNEPVVFPVGQVIPGWTEALQLMNVGSKWKLVVPSELGYGERGTGNGQIPPNSVLLFDVELISIEK